MEGKKQPPIGPDIPKGELHVPSMQPTNDPYEIVRRAILQILRETNPGPKTSFPEQ